MLAAPTFIACASSLRASVFEIFLFPSLKPRAIVMRDEKMAGNVTALAVDGGGRELVVVVVVMMMVMMMMTMQ